MAKKYLMIPIIIFTMALLMPQTSFAADQLCYKGSIASSYVDGSYASRDTAGVSVSAFYNSIGQWGMNRIRVWSRVNNIQSYFDSLKKPIYPSQCSATNAYIGMYSNTGDQTYNIYNWEPEASSYSIPLASVVYDILDYLGIPNNTIEAIVNGITTKVSVSGDKRSKTITFNGGLGSSVDLPSSVSISQADGNVNGVKSSGQAKLWYNLAQGSTFYATGQVKYVYTYYNSGLYTIYPLSGVANKSFTIGM